MIPKIFHRVWLGNNPMPDEFVRYGQTWLDHHSGWEMKLWTDANRPRLANEDLYDETRPAAERSDLLRWELMANFGGVYIDTDFECRKNIETLLLDTGAVLAYESKQYLGTAFLAAEPNHPLFVDAVMGLRFGWQHDRKNVSANSGPLFLDEFLKERSDLDSEFICLPRCLLFPNVGDVYEVAHAYAIHHNAGSWVTGDSFQDESGWEPTK